jgi:ribulose-phosphate 3-epimerase
MALGRSVQIAPSILSANFAELGDQVLEAERAGADLLHIDVMDGRFVPNITVGPLVVRALRPVTRLPLHVHLMIEEPERHIDAFARAGADLITVHVETCPHLHRTIQQIREAGARPAVTLNPATPLVAIQHVLAEVDLVLVMTVNPGFGGQELIPFTLNKVRQLADMLDKRDLTYRIQVDGGVNMSTLDQVLQAGADILVIGSAIFASDEGISSALERFKAAINDKGQPFQG